MKRNPINNFYLQLYYARMYFMFCIHIVLPLQRLAIALSQMFEEQIYGDN